VFNEKIAQDTSSLDEADFHKALKALRKGKVFKQAGSHDVAISMYYVAALAPPDYLDRSVKVALLSRAPCADILATRLIDRAAVRVVLRQLSPGSAVVSSWDPVDAALTNWCVPNRHCQKNTSGTSSTPS
jgi:hypothetical protein